MKRISRSKAVAIQLEPTFFRQLFVHSSIFASGFVMCPFFRRYSAVLVFFARLLTVSKSENWSLTYIWSENPVANY